MSYQQLTVAVYPENGIVRKYIYFSFVCIEPELVNRNIIYEQLLFGGFKRYCGFVLERVVLQIWIIRDSLFIIIMAIR